MTRISPKEHYQWYKTIGKCVTCRKKDVAIGYAQCADCIYKQNQRFHKLSAEKRQELTRRNTAYQKGRHEKGICIKCAKPVCERSKWFCEEHRIAHNKWCREYKRKNRVYRTDAEKEAIKQAKLIAMREGYRRYQETQLAKRNNKNFEVIGRNSLRKAFAKQWGQ